MVETARRGEGMGTSVINGETEIRKILETACGNRELMILVTPYMRFESNFLLLDADSVHARITMSAEEATYGLRSPDLRFRFPHTTRFLEARTKLLGFGLVESRRSLRLSIPKTLQDDEQRRAYRVERVGKISVTFSTPKFELKSGALVNLSTGGARLASSQEVLEHEFHSGDVIAVSIPLTDGILINNRAVVRWVHGKTMGVEFLPTLGTEVMTPLSRWVFQRREEDKERVGLSFVESVPKLGRTSGLVLVSSSQELEDSLQELFTGLLPLYRVGSSLQVLKEAVAMTPALVFFHIPDASLDTRKRLKLFVEVLGGHIPFVLLGTQVENSVLFDLGSEHKAAAVYDLGSKPSSFFLRLVQGILRRHQSEGPKEG
jgi:hypothetical protein